MPDDPAFWTERTPNGCYNLERLLGVGQLVEGAARSSLEELTDWTVWADKIITF